MGRRFGKPGFPRATYPDRYFTDTPFFGRNRTAMKITKADIANTANNASNPQDPWIQAIIGSADALMVKPIIYVIP